MKTFHKAVVRAMNSPWLYDYKASKHDLYIAVQYFLWQHTQ